MVLNIAAIVAGIAVMYGILFISGVAILMILQYYSYSYYLFQIMDIISVVLIAVLLVLSIVLGEAVVKKIIQKAEAQWAIKGYCIVIILLCIYQFMLDLGSAENGFLSLFYSPLIMAVTAVYLLLRNTKQPR